MNYPNYAKSEKKQINKPLYIQGYGDKAISIKRTSYKKARKHI